MGRAAPVSYTHLIVGGLYRLVLFCLRKKKSERFRTIVNRVNLGLLVLSSVLATVGVIGGTLSLIHIFKMAGGFCLS